jgi:hypothetical protein
MQKLIETNTMHQHIKETKRLHDRSQKLEIGVTILYSEPKAFCRWPRTFCPREVKYVIWWENVDLNVGLDVTE